MNNPFCDFLKLDQIQFLERETRLHQITEDKRREERKEISARSRAVDRTMTSRTFLTPFICAMYSSFRGGGTKHHYIFIINNTVPAFWILFLKKLFVSAFVAGSFSIISFFPYPRKEYFFSIKILIDEMM